MKVVAFNGSPRKNGNTERMLRIALDELEAQGVETELVQLGQAPLWGCVACYKCFDKKNGHCSNRQDALNAHIDKMVEADGILIGSPTYFTDVTANTKALIDRAGMVARANDNFYRRKVGAAVVAVRRAGSIHVFDTINHFFLIGEMIVAGSSYWNVGIGADPGDVEKDEEGVETMKTLGQNVAWVLNKLAS